MSVAGISERWASRVSAHIRRHFDDLSREFIAEWVRKSVFENILC